MRFHASSTSDWVTANYLWPGGSNVLSDQPSPWYIDVEAEQDDYVLMMTANIMDTGKVVARIYVDSELFRENTGQDMDLIQVDGFIE